MIFCVQIASVSSANETKTVQIVVSTDRRTRSQDTGLDTTASECPASSNEIASPVKVSYSPSIVRDGKINSRGSSKSDPDGKDRAASSPVKSPAPAPSRQVRCRDDPGDQEASETARRERARLSRPEAETCDKEKRKAAEEIASNGRKRRRRIETKKQSLKAQSSKETCRSKRTEQAKVGCRSTTDVPVEKDCFTASSEEEYKRNSSSPSSVTSCLTSELRQANDATENANPADRPDNLASPADQSSRQPNFVLPETEKDKSGDPHCTEKTTGQDVECERTVPDDPRAVEKTGSDNQLAEQTVPDEPAHTKGEREKADEQVRFYICCLCSQTKLT